MQLFFNPDISEKDSQISFDREESKHIVKVLRKTEGDILNITNGKGLIFEAEIISADIKQCTVKIISVEKEPPPPYYLHMIVAPTKMNDRYEWFLEKAMEIGVNEITPIICDHSERKVVKLERYERVLLSAMKQSLHSRFPKLNEPVSFHGFMKRELEGSKLIAHCEQVLKKPYLQKKVHPWQTVNIMIGPEGDFSKKEIEEALLAGMIDIAVHSAKDMATRLPDDLTIGAVLQREDVRDAFISPKYANLMDMPEGAKIGTSSLRRQAQVKRLRPDLEVVGFRGNVETRLQKLESGVADATFLAVAGLKRLGASDRVTSIVETVDMLPAVAQGAIMIELRAGDIDTQKLVAPLDHQPTALCIACERAFLARLDGSCRTPIAGLAHLSGTSITLAGEMLAPDGSAAFAARMTSSAAAALDLGREVAEALIEDAGPDFLASLHARRPQ